MITSQKIAEIVNGELHGDSNIEIKGAFDLIPGKEACISFLNNSKNSNHVPESKSNLILVPDDFIFSNLKKTIILVKNPKISFFNFIRDYFYVKSLNVNSGIHKDAIISKKAMIGQNVSIGPYVVIEDNAKISSGVSIASNSFVGESTSIGDNSILHPNVTIYNNNNIGRNVEINSGCIIGAHGLGVLKNSSDELLQVPHIGRVEIQDNVILGSGCTIDRATMSKTAIGEGTKIDGQVHIAHNVKVGRNCIIAGQSAIGGSTIIGNNVVLGGQVGIIDNLVIGDNCKVVAKSAVMKSLEDGSIVSGIPAIEHSKKRRLDVLYSKLPELFKKVQKL